MLACACRKLRVLGFCWDEVRDPLDSHVVCTNHFRAAGKRKISGFCSISKRHSIPWFLVLNPDWPMLHIASPTDSQPREL